MNRYYQIFLLPERYYLLKCYILIFRTSIYPKVQIHLKLFLIRNHYSPHI